jgi:serine/threonine-protein kinase
VLDLETGDERVLPLNGTHPRYLSSGHVVYSTFTDTLMAVAFDADQLEVVGDPIPVLEGINTNANGGANVDASADGTLVYGRGLAQQDTPRTLVWVDWEGTEEAVAAEPKPYHGLSLSPDGQQVALGVSDPANQDVWIYDLERDAPTRLTLDPAVDSNPIWTPDGERVLWQSSRDSPSTVFSKAADGTGEAKPLTSDGHVQGPSSISPDGKTLVVWQARGGSVDMGTMSMDDPSTTDTLFENDFRHGHSDISPDGRWIAYASDEEGQNEIYVQPFPNVNDDRVKVSRDGGFSPRWGANSDELFYQAYQGADGESGTVTMMMAPIETESRLSPGNPVVLFSGPYVPGGFTQSVQSYDVSPDSRFLMLKGDAGGFLAARRIVIHQHFDEELRRLFPD